MTGRLPAWLRAALVVAALAGLAAGGTAPVSPDMTFRAEQFFRTEASVGMR